MRRWSLAAGLALILAACGDPYEQGRQAFEEGNWEAAIEQLQQVRRLSEDHDQAQDMIARACLQLGREAYERQDWDTALEWLGIRFVFQPAGIVLVQVLIATAYGTRMLKATFDAIDPRLAAVAMTLGATRTRAFFTVTLASARSGLVAALVMIWARGLALYGPIIAFVGTTSLHTEVMPTRMYLEMNLGNLEAALFLALLMMAMAGVVLLVLKLATGRSADQVSRMLRL